MSLLNQQNSANGSLAGATALRSNATFTVRAVLSLLLVAFLPACLQTSEPAARAATEENSLSTEKSLMPYDERRAILDKVNKKAGSLGNLPLKEAAEEMCAYLKDMHQFEAIGMAEDYTSVWARFRDGVGVVIPITAY